MNTQNNETQYLGLRNIQLLCMDMLRLVDRICIEEGLTYFLSGGTLLGAVRHQGFIPWDDDIDLMMPRPDYERFLAVAEKHLPKRYTLAFPGRVENYAMPWIRIWDTRTRIEASGKQKVYTHTLFLDIFPIDGLPKSPRVCELFFKKIRAHDILLKCARRTGFYEGERLQWLKRPLMALTSLRSVEKYAIGLDRAARRRSFERARYAGVCVVTHYGSRERMPAEVFRGSVDVMFEGETYPAPIGYRTYLSGLYGDYMQLPPEEKRVSNHNIRAIVLPEEEKA